MSPIYEYECAFCIDEDKKPHEFTAFKKMTDRSTMPDCPLCGYSKDVKKVIRTAVPKSQSWRAN